jgi:hypothetical protein
MSGRKRSKHFSSRSLEVSGEASPTGLASPIQELGVKLIAADSPTAFLDDTPTAKLVRQLLGAVSEFDKTMLGAKLKAARDRKLAKGQKCGGRKSYAESNPELVALATGVLEPWSRRCALATCRLACGS